MTALSATKGVFVADGIRAHVEDLGFRPDAVVAWWTRQRCEGVVEGNAGGIGFWTAERSGSVAWASSSAGTRSAAAHAAWGRALLGVDPSTRSITMLTQGVVFGASGFGLTWDVPPGEPWLVHYLALAGARARVGRHAAVAPPGGVVLAVPAFGKSQTVASGLRAGFGAAARDGKGAAGFAVDDGAAPGDVVGEQRTDVAVIPYHSLPLRRNTAWCLQLEGVRAKIGTTLAPKGPGGVPVGVGFRPVALLVFSWGLSAAGRRRRIGRLCLGGTAGKANGCAAWDVANTGDTASSHACSTNRELVAIRDTRTADMHATAVLASFEEEGFTLDWTHSDGGPREVLYVALG